MYLLFPLAFLFTFSSARPQFFEPRQDIDTDNPSASDPKAPPSSFQAPPSSVNPFSTGTSLTPVPASCTDFQRPSDKCLQDLAAQIGGVVIFSGGDMKFDDKSCTDTQKSQLENAVWDAYTLATFAGNVPKTAKEIAAWKTYIGPNYSEQQQRVADNLKRVLDFKAGKKFDIIMSCKDTKKWCNLNVEGKKVGGYAWTFNGWFGYYYYITLCPTFFSLSSLEEKIVEVEERMQNGDLKYAQQADYQKNTGQYLLHEMMHLDSIGKPHIKDEMIDPDAAKGLRAYGPELAYKLAQRPLNQGGGASRTSTNADSYAWLVNTLYFWDLTGYFPRPPRFRDSNLDSASSADQSRGQDAFPMDFGTIDANTTEQALQNRLKSNLDSMQTFDPPKPATTQAPNPIPTPQCSSDGSTFPQPAVESFIDAFCKEKKYWDKVIVSPVSQGTGQTKDGRGKAGGASEEYSLPGTSDKLYIGLMYARESCMGYFTFAQGKTDAEKIQNCKVRFDTVLNGCQTNTITEKRGGTLRDVCAVYTITRAKEDPFKDWYKDQGDFTCTDMNTKGIGGDSSPLHGKCNCWYSGYPGLTDLFKMPPSNNCKDTNRADLLVTP